MHRCISSERFSVKAIPKVFMAFVSLRSRQGHDIIEALDLLGCNYNVFDIDTKIGRYNYVRHGILSPNVVTDDYYKEIDFDPKEVFIHYGCSRGNLLKE